MTSGQVKSTVGVNVATNKRIKYAVFIGDADVLATFYDPVRRGVVVGGKLRMERQMQNLISTYLGDVPAKSHALTRGKIMFFIKVSREKYMEGIVNLENDGYSATLVESFGKVMR